MRIAIRSLILLTALANSIFATQIRKVEIVETWIAGASKYRSPASWQMVSNLEVSRGEISKDRVRGAWIVGPQFVSCSRTKPWKMYRGSFIGRGIYEEKMLNMWHRDFRE